MNEMAAASKATRKARAQSAAQVVHQMPNPSSSDHASLAAAAPERPLFILAAPRSFSSVICAMLGQHPQMYGVPELHLFNAERIVDRRALWSKAAFNMNAGLLRVVAQLWFGGQTESAVKSAREWLRDRREWTTGSMLKAIAEIVHPRILVEKSPSIIRRIEWMERAFAMFPHGRFLHLVRHPRGQGESVLKYLDRQRARGRIEGYRLSRNSRASVRAADPDWLAKFDPQKTWYLLNVNICKFLRLIPAEQKMRLKGEDLLAQSDYWLREVANWLRLRTGPGEIEEMKHPERSPYACLGPAGARCGDDPNFLQCPVLRPEKGEQQTLDGPLSWRTDEQGFLPEVKHLAMQFGYQ